MHRIGDDEAFAADILLARWLRSLKFDEQLIGRYLSHKATLVRLIEMLTTVINNLIAEVRPIPIVLCIQAQIIRIGQLSNASKFTKITDRGILDREFMK